jgi:hypothetical protein
LIKNKRDAQGLWQIIEETHKVFTISRIAAVMKKSARKEYQLMHQGPYQSIITYKERFDIALKAYEEQENAESYFNLILRWISLMVLIMVGMLSSKINSQWDDRRVSNTASYTQ